MTAPLSTLPTGHTTSRCDLAPPTGRLSDDGKIAYAVLLSLGGTFSAERESLATPKATHPELAELYKEPRL